MSGNSPRPAKLPRRDAQLQVRHRRAQREAEGERRARKRLHTQVRHGHRWSRLWHSETPRENGTAERSMALWLSRSDGGKPIADARGDFRAVCEAVRHPRRRWQVRSACKKGRANRRSAVRKELGSSGAAAHEQNSSIILLDLFLSARNPMITCVSSSCPALRKAKSRCDIACLHAEVELVSLALLRRRRGPRQKVTPLCGLIPHAKLRTTLSRRTRLNGARLNGTPIHRNVL